MTKRVLCICAALLLICACALAEGLAPEGFIPEGLAPEGLAPEGFIPDGFTFSGGSGRVTLSCPNVRMEGDQAWATIVFSSPHFTALEVDGVHYTANQDDSTSAFEIPVTLNADIEIVGTTLAMSRPHDVRYTIRVIVGEPVPETAEAAETPEAPAAAAEKPEVEGLVWQRSLPLQYATGFSVDYYEGGYALIDIADGDRVLVVPEDGDPESFRRDGLIVLQKPVNNIYLAATSAMALFDRLDALDSVGMSSLEAADWSIENARAAMEAGRIRFAGKYSEPDYELLLQSDCGLAIESTMIFHTPKVKEMLEQLGIQVLVDRSSYETHPLGRTEWIKLYAALLGKEEAAAEFFDARAAMIESYAGMPNTEKTVAFFYVASDGSVVVRNATDYVPRMIEIAGGRYALGDIVDPDSSRSSVSTTMEQFYAAAIDADFLIYNASIANPLHTLDELYALSPLFRDFRAVRENNVWCTGKDLYQETDDVGELIVDIHNMIVGDGEMRFLTRVE